MTEAHGVTPAEGRIRPEPRRGSERKLGYYRRRLAFPEPHTTESHNTGRWLTVVTVSGVCHNVMNIMNAKTDNFVIYKFNYTFYAGLLRFQKLCF